MRKCCERFALINQKHDIDLGSVLVSQTSFRGETNDGVGKCGLFFCPPTHPLLNFLDQPVRKLLVTKS